MRTVSIKANKLNIRKKPDFSAEIVGTLRRGDKRGVTTSRNGFGKIAEGWIALEFTEEVESSD